MTLIIVAIILLSFLLIATEKFTNVNKAAIAIFAGTVGWVLYICYGTDFVMSQHYGEYTSFLENTVSSSVVVKQFIAKHIFLPYVGEAAEIVLFLLSTMTIVEILNNNGCFDFLSQLLKTRNSKRMLWTLGIITFLISANLDNLTTTVMMLTMMHEVVPSRRQRMIFGSAIVIAANTGGALTVIGNPEGLVLWNIGAVSATNFSMSLIIPCIVAWALPTWMLGRMLPNRVDTEWVIMPYRGDDTNLNTWQRLVMLFVGIGGLWFIPTFHNITKLSPFLGALCVLSILWIVNEIFNHKLMNADQMIQRRTPRVLQYGVIQMML
ncbi:MAG: SLC13 family permease, partial [Prevotella sp.]